MTCHAMTHCTDWTPPYISESTGMSQGIEEGEVGSSVKMVAKISQEENESMANRCW